MVVVVYYLCYVLRHLKAMMRKTVPLCEYKRHPLSCQFGVWCLTAVKIGGCFIFKRRLKSAKMSIVLT